jgi:hypothetical protein
MSFGSLASALERQGLTQLLEFANGRAAEGKHTNELACCVHDESAATHAMMEVGFIVSPGVECRKIGRHVTLVKLPGGQATTTF